MKKTKKLTAVALSVMMAAGGMTTAYGSSVTEATNETQVEATKVVTAKGDTSMNLTGTIKVTNLSVTIPTVVSFNMDMTKIPASGATLAKADTANMQVEQPDDNTYKITNNSASSVWVYVTGVTTTKSGTGTAPTLVSSYTDVKSTANNIMFGIKDSKATGPKVGTYTSPKTEPDEIGTAADWMTSTVSSTNKYYLNTNHGKLIAADLATAAKENEMALTIYAFTRKGWTAGDKFNITPVFTVAVEDPATP